MYLFKYSDFFSSVSEPFWEDYTDKNIKNAEAQRLNAVQLRNVTDGILKKLVADMKQAVEKTRRSFDRRIFESKQAKQKLEDQLRDVSDEKAKKTAVIQSDSFAFRLICSSINWRKVLKIQRKPFVIRNNT